MITTTLARPFLKTIVPPLFKNHSPVPPLLKNPVPVPFPKNLDSHLSPEKPSPCPDFTQPLLYFIFLNQVRAGRRPAHAWFLRIASVRECLYACVCVCVCPRPRGYE